jgi:hypothetical protein
MTVTPVAIRNKGTPFLPSLPFGPAGFMTNGHGSGEIGDGPS